MNDPFATEPPTFAAQARTTGAAPVRLSVNGAVREVAAGTTLAAVVAELTGGNAPVGSADGRRAAGIAAALNEAVVPRGAWDRTPVRDGDRVEVLTAVQGG
ncbi:sulfur carrier protein ThiS [Streptomyces spiramenti]|uniref:Sulfur carrier protein ThiS n=1 Tax=Streptomyces spiramenti TaxID=2720606 RepID=A0ABX1AWB6_9ACTN|nr:sulfur carrier protein ThiS [Streptomyces spiramenti]NJP68547.1 sulfur carrier protein ThiS [Streptomyces spiramenti]